MYDNESMAGVDGCGSDADIIGDIVDGMGRGGRGGGRRGGGRRGGGGGRRWRGGRGFGPVIIDDRNGYGPAFPYYEIEDVTPINVIMIDPNLKKEKL